jgi:hypothetical protein
MTSNSSNPFEALQVIQKALGPDSTLRLNLEDRVLTATFSSPVFERMMVPNRYALIAELVKINCEWILKEYLVAFRLIAPSEIKVENA